MSCRLVSLIAIEEENMAILFCVVVLLLSLSLLGWSRHLSDEDI